MEGEEITNEHIVRHVEPRLRLQVQFYLVVSAAIVLFIAYRIAAHGGHAFYTLAGLILGAALGFALARVFRVSWDRSARTAVFRMDVFGVLLLCAYIALEAYGEHVLRHYFGASQALTLILAFAAGVLLSRGISMRRQMLAVLREHI